MMDDFESFPWKLGRGHHWKPTNNSCSTFELNENVFQGSLFVFKNKLRHIYYD